MSSDNLWKRSSNSKKRFLSVCLILLLKNVSLCLSCVSCDTGLFRSCWSLFSWKICLLRSCWSLFRWKICLLRSCWSLFSWKLCLDVQISDISNRRGVDLDVTGVVWNVTLVAMKKMMIIVDSKMRRLVLYRSMVWHGSDVTVYTG